jgi:hypothetical protein
VDLLLHAKETERETGQSQAKHYKEENRKKKKRMNFEKKKKKKSMALLEHKIRSKISGEKRQVKMGMEMIHGG